MEDSPRVGRATSAAYNPRYGASGRGGNTGISLDFATHPLSAAGNVQRMRELKPQVPGTSAEQYLARARAAEAIADDLPHGDLRNAWLGLADSYRELAESLAPCSAD